MQIMNWTWGEPTPDVLLPGTELDRLPPSAAARLADWEQRRADAHANLMAISDRLAEQHDKRRTAEARAKLLLASRGEGGFSADEADTTVRAERAKIAKANTEIERLKVLEAARTEVWQIAARPVDRAREYVQRAGVLLTEYAGSAPELRKGEDLATAIENRRRRVRELMADAHRTRSAPYPSAIVKQKVHEQIAALAERGRPHALGSVEQMRDIEFAQTYASSLVQVIEPRGFGTVLFETPDAIGLVAWLMREQMTKLLDAEIDALSDDKAALTDDQRAKLLVQISNDMLATEREEAALIERAAEAGMTIVHRPDIDPRALLNVVGPEPRQG